MEEFKKNIEGIRQMMTEMKSEKYALVNPYIVSLDEYVKNLYLKVLCTVVQYGNDPTDMQTLYLKRIVKGVDVEAAAEEYMRKALEISETDIQEFLSHLGGSTVRYYFTLDGILLVSLGSPEQICYEYLAQLIELLDVSKEDLQYICMVAQSVLQQQPSLYDEAKTYMNEQMQKVDWAPYIQNYYIGAIADTDTEKYYFAPNKKLSEGIVYGSVYREERVVFENLDITLTEDWSFEKCKEVVFKNCMIHGGDYSIHFTLCKDIRVLSCCFKDFDVPVFIEEENHEVQIKGCEFKNCKAVGYYKRYGWGGGYYCTGIIQEKSNKNMTPNIITESVFEDCKLKNKDYSSNEYYIISNSSCKVSNCQFYDCWDERKDRPLFSENTEGENNEIIRSAAFKMNEEEM